MREKGELEMAMENDRKLVHQKENIIEEETPLGVVIMRYNKEEDGFEYCIHEGANLVAPACRESIPALDALPSAITDDILVSIIGEGNAYVNINGNWVGSLNGLGGGYGYWFVSNSDACFNINCSE